MKKKSTLHKLAVLLGRRGGRARSKKFTHEDFVKWGQMARGKKKNKK